MTHVNDRAVDKLGPLLLPVVDGLDDHPSNPSLSPERAPPPAAPVFLLHGADDTVIPSVETVLLAQLPARQDAGAGAAERPHHARRGRPLGGGAGRLGTDQVLARADEILGSRRGWGLGARGSGSHDVHSAKNRVLPGSRCSRRPAATQHAVPPPCPAVTTSRLAEARADRASPGGRTGDRVPRHAPQRSRPARSLAIEARRRRRPSPAEAARPPLARARSGQRPRSSDDRPGAIRLQKLLSMAGVASRRTAEVLIAEGRVTVNGAVVEHARRQGRARRGRRQGRRPAHPAGGARPLHPAQQAARLRDHAAAIPRAAGR